jgi:hypothetical protein
LPPPQTQLQVGNCISFLPFARLMKCAYRRRVRSLNEKYCTAEIGFAQCVVVAMDGRLHHVPRALQLNKNATTLIQCINYLQKCHK